MFSAEGFLSLLMGKASFHLTVSVTQSKPVVFLECNSLISLWFFCESSCESSFYFLVFPLNIGISSKYSSWSSFFTLYTAFGWYHWLQGFTRIQMLMIPKSLSLKQPETPELTNQAALFGCWSSAQETSLIPPCLLLTTCISQIHTLVVKTVSASGRRLPFLACTVESLLGLHSLLQFYPHPVHSPHWSQTAFSNHKPS